MSADGSPASESFLLERFTWVRPDRLELAGTFTHLGSPPHDAPVLVLHGEHRVHRLPAVPEGSSGTPEDGEPWQAAFAWSEPPELFSAAELELGVLAVALPEPTADGADEPQVLPVRRPEPPESAWRIGLETELLTAREQLREMLLQAAREHDELERVTAALDAERARRASDNERYLVGIAQVRAVAEESLAGEHATVARLTGELEEAIAERDALRERVATLESQARDAETALASLDPVRESAEAATADAEQLLGRMQKLRNALSREG